MKKKYDIHWIMLYIGLPLLVVGSLVLIGIKNGWT